MRAVKSLRSAPAKALVLLALPISALLRVFGRAKFI
jgi:hypothetical protein